MGPVTVAGQSDCILLPEPAGLTVLAATKGSLRIQSAAVTGTLLRGQAVVLPPDSGCCLTAHEPGECLAVVLSGTLVERLMQGHYETGKLFCAAGLGDVLEAGHVLKATGTSSEQISAAAYRLLMRLHETARPYETSSGYPLLVDAGIGIMQQEFAHLYGVDEVAERLGVTTAHFTRLFSQTVGTPPGRLLKQQKLAYAKKNNCRLIAGTETIKITPTNITYYYSGKDKLVTEQGVLRQKLDGTGYNKLGGAIHHVYSWYELMTK